MAKSLIKRGIKGLLNVGNRAADQIEAENKFIGKVGKAVAPVAKAALNPIGTGADLAKGLAKKLWERKKRRPSPKDTYKKYHKFPKDIKGKDDEKYHKFPKDIKEKVDKFRSRQR